MWQLETDSNGEKYGSWLKNSARKGIGWGECTFCKTELNIEAGKPNIAQHARTGKHKKHQLMVKSGNNSAVSRQPNIHQALVRQDEVSQPEKKAKLLEIMILQSFSRHNIPPAYWIVSFLFSSSMHQIPTLSRLLSSEVPRLPT